jgi:hypothetical protein
MAAGRMVVIPAVPIEQLLTSGLYLHLRACSQLNALLIRQIQS